MQNNSENKGFFDSKTIVTIALMMLFWFGWQKYMESKYPDLYKKDQIAATSAENAESVAVNVQNEKTEGGAVSVENKAAIVKGNTTKQEQTISYEDDWISFHISSKGMGIKEIYAKEYLDREKKVKRIDSENMPGGLFETSFVGQLNPVEFNLKQVGRSEFIGTAEVNGAKVTRTLTVDSQRYMIQSKVRVDGNLSQFIGLNTRLVQYLMPKQSSGFLLPSFDHQEFFVMSDGKEDRWVVDPATDAVKAWPKTTVLSLGSQYFVAALVDRSGVIPDFKAFVKVKAAQAEGILTHTTLAKDQAFETAMDIYVGPKSFNILQSIDPVLPDIINYGMFSSIAKYILKLLKLFHSWIGNWGLAIILLTCVVRLMVFPFNLMSYKSMKAMQVIQPKINALREKYKNDTQKLNQEMMGMMREHKVNPLGGCLPVLLQLPIFLALYQVLGQSVELYQAPFMGWIQDLSLKDPFYVLPVLMGITMFAQQKLTPSTMDPTQAKIMMFMPILFSFLMISLPSGLTLYIFVSALFGVGQQLYFLKYAKI